MGVSTPPGCTELHRMWSRACRVAVILVNKRTAPLEAIYAGGPIATRPEIDEMFTIEPPPARRMAGMACFVPKNTPFAFTAMMRSQSASVVSSIPLRSTMPALSLQRDLTRCRWHSPSSVRQKGAVVALLPLRYQVEDVLTRQGFEGQDHLQQGPQLGYRQGRGVFSPSVSVNARGRSGLTSW